MSSFKNKHIGISAIEEKQMLNFIGCKSMKEFIDNVIPNNIQLKEYLRLPPSIDEYTLKNNLQALANHNSIYKTYIGNGYYDTITPTVVQRALLENPAWYTAYTPYQAEISQGRLEVLLVFQTMICELTGLPIANASLLDEGTAAAEAMTMLWEYQKRSNIRANTFFIDKGVHDHVADVVMTRASGLNINCECVSLNENHLKKDNVCGILLAYTQTNGAISDYDHLIKIAHQHNIGVALTTDLLALNLLQPPSLWNVDVVVGSTQRFGVPTGYGGPHAAFFATQEKYKRLVPGRIIGVSKDIHGNNAIRMALQTREQHIRRERATSNICTAQVLPAIIATMYAIYHGADALYDIAKNIHQLTKKLAISLSKLGYDIVNKTFFDTLSIKLPNGIKTQKLHSLFEKNKINLCYLNDNTIKLSLDECKQPQDIDLLIKLFASLIQKPKPSTTSLIGIPKNLIRTNRCMQQDVFCRYNTEHEFIRYVKNLENKDFSLVHGMIPLGSCTMKLNAASEMQSLTWDNFSKLHPFIPIEQAKGYQLLISHLEDYLKEITGLDAISFQPNSGAQGEYTGLRIIQAYHHDHGESQRNVVLIPSSAHGTNPASARMAGMKIITIKCNDNGNIDYEHLEKQAYLYKNELSACMITYPSTHGVYEANILKVVEIIHQYGGLVYMDGANMNAQIGLTSPKMIGIDVCHLNLHKTFCIPHGGGGPGMGPIAVTKKLIPYLPDHSHNRKKQNKSIGAIASSPWGSASILTISYSYLCLMGEEGIRRASEIAMLNANYIMERLKDKYDILYKGENNRIAHEFIIDIRTFDKDLNIIADDIAKRLIDYGFHAPTISFPVPNTMMIEPTESESKYELDRFCNAMLSIRKEIENIQKNETWKHSNPLKNAPHTMHVICANTWTYPYSRQQAAFPMSYNGRTKFWPSVARVKGAEGDRNLICCLSTFSSDVDS